MTNSRAASRYRPSPTALVSVIAAATAIVLFASPTAHAAQPAGAAAKASALCANPGCPGDQIVEHPVAVGKATVCAVLLNRSLTCWGSNSDGQAVPSSGTDFASVALGGYHGCAIRTDHTVACWGDGHFRQTTVGGPACVPDLRVAGLCAATPANPSIEANDISLGKFHTCAVLTDRSLACWGLDLDPFGNPGGQVSGAPTDYDFRKVSAGGYHTCGLRDEGSIACWGGNWVGQTDAPSGADFAQIAAGRTHTCALSKIGSISCWGENTDGRATPPAGTGFKAIAAGYSHSCAIRSSNSIICWGSNSLGQRNAPSGSFTNLAVGGNSAIARRSDGTIATWGSNSDGQGDIPTGVSSGAPALRMALINGLGKGRWSVMLVAKAGKAPIRKVQFSVASTRPSNSVAATSTRSWSTKVTVSGKRPRWVRIADSAGRWTAWEPVQPQVDY